MAPQGWPWYAPADPTDRTEYRAGGIVQCDMWFPPKIVPAAPGVMAAPSVLVWDNEVGIGQHYKRTLATRNQRRLAIVYWIEARYRRSRRQRRLGKLTPIEFETIRGHAATRAA